MLVKTYRIFTTTHNMDLKRLKTNMVTSKKMTCDVIAAILKVKLNFPALTKSEPSRCKIPQYNWLYVEFDYIFSNKD